VNIQPKVSIVIPVYNGSDYLSEAIESALAQTYPNKEVVVINDGSVDNGETERIALSYGRQIRYYAKENGGVGSALNLAISKMSGEYFSWLSHDDLYYPDKIALQVQALAEISGMERVILYGDYAAFFGDAVDRVSEKRLPHVPPELFRYFITTQNVLHGCTLLVPKRAFEECGVFNESLRTTQDYDLWFRMAGKYRFVHMPQLLVMGRSHAGQGSVKMKDVALNEINEMLSGFVMGLSKEELSLATLKTPALTYARTAENFLLRGFSKAARIARKLALENLWGGSVWDGLLSLLILLRGMIIGAPFGRLRGILSRLRFKARKCLG